MKENRERVGILCGGLSAEREQSFVSGRQVYSLMDRGRYEPVLLFLDSRAAIWALPEALIPAGCTADVERQLETATRISYEALPAEVDVVFVLTHGKYGEDGCLQGLLELLDIPYTSSGVLASGLALDKVAQQAFLRQAGLRCPRSEVISTSDWQTNRELAIARIHDFTTFPVIVKPTREGSSIGVMVAKDNDDLARALDFALQYDREALVEEYLRGLEFSCIVLGDDPPTALPPTEISSAGDFVTYEDKFMPGGATMITPAQVSSAIMSEIQQGAVAAHIALGFVGYSRIDGFVVGNEVYITDPHPTCGMGPSAFIWQQAAESDIMPQELLSRIIVSGQRAHRRKVGPL